MPRDRKRWTPNPYAIGRQLRNRENIRFLYFEEGAVAEEWLKAAFELNRKNQTLSEVLKQFRQLTEVIRQPLTLARALELPQVRALGYKRDQLARVLPLLLNITDVGFVVPGEPSPPPELILGTYGPSRNLLVNGVHYLDPIQGDSADCYLISSMISLAWTRQPMFEGRLNAGFQPGMFKWQFHKNNQTGTPGQQIQVSELTLTDSSGQPLYAHSRDQHEFWPALLEKAYVRLMSPGAGEPIPDDYKSLDNGDLPQDACQSLVGSRTGTQPLFTAVGKKIFEQGPNSLGTLDGIMSKPVMAWTEEVRGTKLTWEKTGIWEDHAYAVLGVTPAGRFTHVVLRNPLGIANAIKPGYATGIWQAGAEAVELNKNGVFAIPKRLFFAKFQHIGWINLP